MTAWSIGIAKGKHHWVHSDPYTSGEQSSKHAKSDVTSAIANMCAHMYAAPLSATAPTPFMPTEMLTPPSTTMPTLSTHPEMQVALVLAFPPQSVPTPMLLPYIMSFTKMHTCMNAPQ